MAGGGCILHPHGAPAGMKTAIWVACVLGLPPTVACLGGGGGGHLRWPVSLDPERRGWGRQAGTRLTRGAAERLEGAASGRGHMSSVRHPGLLFVQEGWAEADGHHSLSIYYVPRPTWRHSRPFSPVFTTVL